MMSDYMSCEVEGVCRVPFSPWTTLQTTVGVTLKGAEVTDVYGTSFPTYTNTSTLDHR